MKLILASFICIVIPVLLTGQIGGVTGSKISSFNAAAIPQGTAEFEPSYSFSSSSQFWDNDGTLQPLLGSNDIVQKNTSIALRMAYPMTEKLEVGSILTSNSSSWSFKHLSYSRNKLDIGVMGGVNIPYGNTIIDKNNKQAGQVLSYGMGGIFSYQFTDDGSMDVNIQYQDYAGSADGLQNSDIFISADYGQYFDDQSWQLVASFLYQYSAYDQSSGSILSFTPGIIFEMKKDYLIVINGSFALTGSNNTKSNGMSIAWTITI